MTEKNYNQAVRALFAQIESLLEDSDADFENNEAIIDITTANEKIVINKQSIKQEVWLASKSGGGHHFTYKDGQWRNTKNGTLLLDQLKQLLSLSS